MTVLCETCTFSCHSWETITGLTGAARRQNEYRQGRRRDTKTAASARVNLQSSTTPSEISYRCMREISPGTNLAKSSSTRKESCKQSKANCKCHSHQILHQWTPVVCSRIESFTKLIAPKQQQQQMLVRGVRRLRLSKPHRKSTLCRRRIRSRGATRSFRWRRRR